MKVVDMHCDTILRLYDEGGNLLENEFNIERLYKLLFNLNLEYEPDTKRKVYRIPGCK